VTAKLTTVSASVTPSTSLVRPQRSQTVALVPFLFGVTGTDELAGVALTRLLGDLGMGAAAARQPVSLPPYIPRTRGFASRSVLKTVSRDRSKAVWEAAGRTRKPANRCRMCLRVHRR